MAKECTSFGNILNEVSLHSDMWENVMDTYLQSMDSSCIDKVQYLRLNEPFY